MIDFNICVKSSVDHKWYTVIDVSFRFWKNHPSDGLNGGVTILSDDGPVFLENGHIEEIRFNIF